MINFELASLDILFADMWVQNDKQVTALVSGQSVENPDICMLEQINRWCRAALVIRNEC